MPTIAWEDLPEDMQKFVDETLASAEPVFLAGDDGRVWGKFPPLAHDGPGAEPDQAELSQHQPPTTTGVQTPWPPLHRP